MSFVMINRVCSCHKINGRMYRNLLGPLRDLNLICIIQCNRGISSIAFYNDKRLFIAHVNSYFLTSETSCYVKYIIHIYNPLNSFF